VDACLDLNGQLQEWKLVMNEQYDPAEESFDDIICNCLDRLAKLIGLLQFDGISVEQT
jgi:tRNA A37 threonylcarbamoyltransferase TsaD